MAEVVEAGISFTVRISGPDGTAGGLGVLVDATHVITCAHVVNAALGLDEFAQPQPKGQPLLVWFPLLDRAEAGPVAAEVVKWLPPPKPGVAGDDIAGLELIGQLPAGAGPARLAVDPPRIGHQAYVFGYPAAPVRPDGARVEATVRGQVGNGRLQLDSTPDSAHRIQPGFSGSPVIDAATGRVIGVLAEAARQEARDSRAISVARLRLAWPEVLAARWQRAARARRRERGEVTVLHVSDPRFARDQLNEDAQNRDTERVRHPLFGRLHADLAGLAADGLRPDLLVVSGNLTEHGYPAEFQAATDFIAALAEEAEVPRRHVAIVPGDHDVNRLACQAYFLQQESNGEHPVPPYWPKWHPYREAFDRFYADQNMIAFTPDEPWTLFEINDLAVVVAGLNSTIPDTHQEADHYGEAGERQLRWFARRLADHKERGWLRLAVIHHGPAGGPLVPAGAPSASAALRDADDLDDILGQSRLVNLLLHGHAPEVMVRRLPSGLVTLSAGAVSAAAATPQYQLITIRRDGLTRAVRQYGPGGPGLPLAGRGRWVGDTRVSPAGSDWRDRVDCTLTEVDEALPPPPTPVLAEAEPAGEPSGPAGKYSITIHGGTGIQIGDHNSQANDAGQANAAGTPLAAGPAAEFFERVTDATRAKEPHAVIAPRAEDGYLRVTVARGGGRIGQWPVGVIDGPATEQAVDAFVAQVHRQFAADDPGVLSELVYRVPGAATALVESARRHRVLLRSLAEYQGLLDLTPLTEAQRDRLANDPLYPAARYIDQRYRIIGGGGHTDEVREKLIDRAVQWLAADGARLVVVLGDPGRGKTSFLRQLTRVLPDRLPNVTPILVELRSLEKAPSLDELLAQHLARRGVDDISLGKLRFMINAGRIGLLLDGFDELELRVGYEGAADYLQTLIGAVTGQAKVILTSRTQHFRSTAQVTDALAPGQPLPGRRTALGDRVETRPESRVAVLEEFSDEQILTFLANLYDGDADRAQARFDLIDGIGNLLDLAHNPRMLGFAAALDEDRLLAARDAVGQVSAARLYEQIIDQWLETETERHRHRGGLRPITKPERLAACTALALRLWVSRDQAIALRDLSAEVTATLTDLTGRGYTEDQAAHAIASGTLLVRTEDGAFAFIHPSVMEWLVARAAAEAVRADRGQEILGARQMSALMVAFLVDLMADGQALGWAAETLAAAHATETSKQNALAIEGCQRNMMLVLRTAAAVGLTEVARKVRRSDRNRAAADVGEAQRDAGPTRTAQAAAPLPGSVDLAGVDLRGHDLTGRDLRKANLRGANLSGMRLADVDLSGADLSEADLTGTVLTGGSLRDAILAGSRWDRAAILGAAGLADPATASAPELAVAAVVGAGPDDAVHRNPPQAVRQDPAEVMVAPPSDSVGCVAFSPDGTLLAYVDRDVVKLCDASRGRVLRILGGHGRSVYAVAFSPDGSLIATASNTVRAWDVVTGEPRASLTEPGSYASDVAFSPDGALIATVGGDTVRIWDAVTGEPRATLTGHSRSVDAVAFSPDGSLVATASWDGTARIWDAASGEPRVTLAGHDAYVRAVVFSPDGSLVATGSEDNTARIWDAASGAPRITLTGHGGWVWGVAFSPDGSLFATAGGTTARIWDAASGAPRVTLTGHVGSVSGVVFSPSDGSLVATASSDHTVRTWDAVTGVPRVTFTGHGSTVNAVVFSPPDGSLIATADGRTVRTWDAVTGVLRTSLTVSWSAAFAFSPDGSLVATAGGSTARISDAVTGAPRLTLSGHSDDVRAVAFSPDGSLIATASRDRTARIWDAVTGAPRATLSGHDEWVNAVVFSPVGSLIATASGDHTARVWNLNARRARLRKAAPAAIVLLGHSNTVYAVAFSPDGSVIATASADSTARIWDAATGVTRATLTGHDGYVQAVVFSPDGSLVATASADHTARTWDAATGEPRVTLTGHDGAVNDVAFSPRGNLIATASNDGTTRIWGARGGAHLATLVALSSGGYATLLPGGRYKIDGDPGDGLWWAVKLCRFGPGELDPYVPGIQRLAPDDPVLPSSRR